MANEKKQRHLERLHQQVSELREELDRLRRHEIPWTPFVQVAFSRAAYVGIMPPDEAYENNLYMVLVRYIYESGDSKVLKYTHLSFRRHDKDAYIPWRHKQKIKNLICGTEREAVELFPAESRLVDTSNQYHIFCLPPGEKFDFGYTTRLVSDSSDLNIKQQPFEEDNRPADLIHISSVPQVGAILDQRAANKK